MHQYTIGRRMSKPTLTSVTEQLHSLDTRSHRLEVQTTIQFKDLFNRVKRLETIFISVAATIIIILLTIAFNI